MAEFTLVDLHYQLRDLHDFIEVRTALSPSS